MVRNTVKSKTYAASRKVAAARSALNRASTILRRRGTGLVAPPATRGFYNRPYGYGSGRPELKFIDTQTTAEATSNTWKVNLINGVATGTDITNRIGRKITLKSLLVRLNVYNSMATNTTNPQGVMGRIVLIYDTQPNSGTTPTGTDIFTTNTPFGFMNLNNRDRFKVLKDWQYAIGAWLISGTGLLAAGSPENKMKTFYKKINYDEIFSGVGNTQGDIATGAMYLCHVCDVNLGGFIDWGTRVRFIDN